MSWKDRVVGDRYISRLMGAPGKDVDGNLHTKEHTRNTYRFRRLVLGTH